MAKGIVIDTKGLLKDAFFSALIPGYPNPLHKLEVDKARVEGFKYGERQGNIETAKKFKKSFKEYLENSEANKLAMWALGVYVASLDGIADEEMAAIFKKVGDPNSNSVNPALREKYMEIYNEIPRFSEIRVKYLDKADKEFMEELNEYVNQIIESDTVISEEESNFLRFEWYPYLSSRGITVKKILKDDYHNDAFERLAETTRKLNQMIEMMEGSKGRQTVEDDDGETAEQLFNKGWRYEHGDGVQEDIEYAKDLYRKAAEKGNQMAKSRLNFLASIS